MHVFCEERPIIILRSRDFQIWRDAQQRGVVSTALRDLDPDRYQFPSPGTVREILREISAAKQRQICYGQAPSSRLDPGNVGSDMEALAARVYPRYATLMRDSDAMDFDDLLLQTDVLLVNNPGARANCQDRFQYVLVDEMQDMNLTLYKLVKLLSQPQNNLLVVGDEDQSIYGWNGADWRNFLNFKDEYPQARILPLERNYRSTTTILKAAQQVVRKNPGRLGKSLFTKRDAGMLIRVYKATNEFEEVDYVVRQIAEAGEGWSDFAVLCRNNYLLDPLQKAFERAGIPTQKVSSEEDTLQKMEEIQDLLAYLHLCIDSNRRISFLRVLNAPRRGIGPVTREEFHQWCRQEGLTVGDALGELLDGANPQSVGRVKPLRDFAELLYGWRSPAREERMTLLFDRIMKETDYEQYVATYSHSSEKAQDCINNLRRLREFLESAEAEGQGLETFLATDPLAAIEEKQA